MDKNDKGLLKSRGEIWVNIDNRPYDFKWRDMGDFDASQMEFLELRAQVEVKKALETEVYARENQTRGTTDLEE